MNRVRRWVTDNRWAIIGVCVPSFLAGWLAPNLAVFLWIPGLMLGTYLDRQRSEPSLTEDPEAIVREASRTYREKNPKA